MVFSEEKEEPVSTPWIVTPQNPSSEDGRWHFLTDADVPSPSSTQEIWLSVCSYRQPPRHPQASGCLFCLSSFLKAKDHTEKEPKESKRDVDTLANIEGDPPYF